MRIYVSASPEVKRIKLAWKEMKYNRKKYLLVEIIVVLMLFMVLFLSGLVKELGRAFASDAKLILADEPTASLDSRRGRDVVKMIQMEVHERHKSAIMVTHDVRILSLVDRVYRMEDGKLNG